MQLCEDGLTLAKCELYVLKNEKTCGEKWVNFDGKNGDGDGDENDDDDDEIMRNERIHDAQSINQSTLFKQGKWLSKLVFRHTM